jgi:peptide-methionine (S)-S-oxide reductase
MRAQRIILIVAVALGLGYAWLGGAFVKYSTINAAAADDAAAVAQSSGGRRLQKATFAGGCFWCVESDFDTVKGVVETISGYTGGRVRNPTYEDVSAGGTGHAEAVEILFDPAVVSYEQLLDRFWRNVDPFVANRQFCDVGSQYRPEIFVHDESQRALAEASKKRMQQRFSAPIVVNITTAGPFYRAEDYHQDYHNTHSIQYRYYRWRCGRDARLEEIWRGRT